MPEQSKQPQIETTGEPKQEPPKQPLTDKAADVPKQLPQIVIQKAQGIGGAGADNGTDDELRELFTQTLSELSGKSERALWEFTRRHHRYSVVKVKPATRAKSYVKAFAGRVVLWNKHRQLLKPNGADGASLIRPPKSLEPENARHIPR